MLQEGLICVRRARAQLHSRKFECRVQALGMASLSFPPLIVSETICHRKSFVRIICLALCDFISHQSGLCCAGCADELFMMKSSTVLLNYVCSLCNIYSKLQRLTQAVIAL